MVLCLLATDDEEEDVALQIHFTLIQAFCCENDINILRVSNMRRLAELLGGVKSGGEPMDLHCVLVTVSVDMTHLRCCSLPFWDCCPFRLLCKFQNSALSPSAAESTVVAVE